MYSYHSILLTPNDSSSEQSSSLRTSQEAFAASYQLSPIAGYFLEDETGLVSLICVEAECYTLSKTLLDV